MDKNSNFFNVNPIHSVKQQMFTAADNLTEEAKHSEDNRRLNGYDYNILNDKTLPQAENEKLKLEYKINEKQKELTDINGKIKNAELYGTQNEVLSLRARKHRIEKELSELNKQYTEANKSVKTLTGELIEMQWVRKTQTFLSKNILSKISKKFNSIVFLGESMKKLASINSAVDALIEMKVPYGEKNENYEKLTEYLYQANQLHSEISRALNNIK